MPQQERRYCQAEAPFDDAIAYCQLGPYHITGWHESIVNPKCPECGRREEHEDNCSEYPDNLPAHAFDRVRWQGPRSYMPMPDVWVRVTIKRFMDESAGLLDWVLGGHHLVNEFLDEAEEWGRELGPREVVREYKPRA